MIWQMLTQDPKELADARLQLHWAAQALAAAGVAHQAHREDDSHTSFEWDEEALALVGGSIDGLRPALSPRDGALMVLADDSTTLESFGLRARTLAESMVELADVLQRHGARRRELTLPTYEMPAHRYATKSTFSANSMVLAEMGRWYANASTILERVRSAHPGASKVRCWPHHFDIATLIPAGEGRSVGVGMTPGDANYPEPYWYVTAWPYPENPELPELPYGQWHREGWVGAVQTGTTTMAGGRGNQEARVTEFLEAAVQACRQLLTSGAR